jgi:hypothetical protein
VSNDKTQEKVAQGTGLGAHGTHQRRKVGVDPDAVLPDQTEDAPQHVSDVDVRAVSTAPLLEQVHHVAGESVAVFGAHVVLQRKSQRKV